MPKRNVFLFDIVYPESAQKVVEEILDFNTDSNEPINLIINSPGGLVSAAFAIIDTINEVEAPVNTIVLGEAASAGAVIASCGENRMIGENAKMMLHEVRGGTFGKISDMEKSVAFAREVNERLFSILAENTGKSLKELKDAIGEDDVWFEAKEAIDFGLADIQLDAKEIKKFKLSENFIVENTEITDSLEENEDHLSLVPLMKVGKFYDERYGEIDITEHMLDCFINNFKNNIRGLDISIDYTHDNDTGQRIAAGWFSDIIKKEKQLFGLVDFNEKGRELISQEAFKYASPEYVNVYTDDKGRSHSFVLLGATLTNRPVIKNNGKIKLSEGSEIAMDLEQAKQLVNSKMQINIDSLVNENVNLKSENETLKETNSELENSKKELDDLKAENIVKEKEAAFKQICEDEKKVSPGQKEAILDKFETGQEILDFYKDAPAILESLTKPDGSTTNSGDAHLTDVEQAAIDSGKVTEEDVLRAKEIEAKING